MSKYVNVCHNNICQVWDGEPQVAEYVVRCGMLKRCSRWSAVLAQWGEGESKESPRSPHIGVIGGWFPIPMGRTFGDHWWPLVTIGDHWWPNGRCSTCHIPSYPKQCMAKVCAQSWERLENKHSARRWHKATKCVAAPPWCTAHGKAAQKLNKILTLHLMVSEYVNWCNSAYQVKALWRRAYFCFMLRSTNPKVF